MGQCGLRWYIETKLRIWNIVYNNINIFSNLIRKPKAAIITSRKITEILHKNKMPSEDGNMIKNGLLAAGDSLFNKFKNKTEICDAIKRSSYLGILSVEDCNVCPITLWNI